MKRPGSVAILVMVACLAALYPLQRRIDHHNAGRKFDSEFLYVSDGRALQQASFGFHSLLADLYWLRSIQYFGRKVVANRAILNQRSEALGLLYPLIDVTTSLDTRHIDAYRFGGFFVHDYVDATKGYALLDKGIQHNPDEWALYNDKAFVLWTDGLCDEAAATYERGAKVPGAPTWLKTMAAAVVAECYDEQFAADSLRLMYESSTDPMIRDAVLKRIAGLVAQEDLDLLRERLEVYRSRFAANPSSLGELLKATGVPTRRDGTPLSLDQDGNPVDPNGVPYSYYPRSYPKRPVVNADWNSVVLPSRAFKRQR